MTNKARASRKRGGSEVELTPFLKKRRELVNAIDRICASWNNIELLKNEDRQKARQVITEAQDLVFKLKCEKDAESLAMNTIETYTKTLGLVVDELNKIERNQPNETKVSA